MHQKILTTQLPNEILLHREILTFEVKVFDFCVTITAGARAAKTFPKFQNRNGDKWGRHAKS